MGWNISKIHLCFRKREKLLGFGKVQRDCWCWIQLNFQHRSALGLGLLWALEREEGRGRADGDGEHLIAACNADEGGQVLEEVLAVAPFLVLRRYLILKLSWFVLSFICRLTHRFRLVKGDKETRPGSISGLADFGGWWNQVKIWSHLSENSTGFHRNKVRAIFN